MIKLSNFKDMNKYDYVLVKVLSGVAARGYTAEEVVDRAIEITEELFYRYEASPNAYPLLSEELQEGEE